MTWSNICVTSRACLLYFLPLLMFSHVQGQLSPSEVGDYDGDCPEGCLCYYPSREPLFVNCRLAGLSTVPVGIPLTVVVLDLSYNSIERLPTNAFGSHLAFLYSVELAYNNIKTIEDGAFNELTKLHELTLSGNYVGEFSPETFSGLSNLTSLFCHNCIGINNLENGVFVNVPKLQRLLLRNCSISDIGDRVFDHVPDLAYLDLSENGLTRLPKLNNLASLRNVTFRGNRITSIDFTNLWHSSRLLSFDIGSNHLTNLTTEMVDFLCALDEHVQVLMDNNPWTCDCDMMRVVVKWPRVPRVLREQITCRSPAKFDDMDLWHVPRDQMCANRDTARRGSVGDLSGADEALGDEKYVPIIIGVAIGSALGTLASTIIIVVCIYRCRSNVSRSSYI